MEKRPRVVVSVVAKKDGKFLLIKEKLEDEKEYWIVPGGGVRFGESLEQAALRELKEEVGLELKNLKLINHHQAIFPNFDYHTIIFFFLAETEGKPKLSKKEKKILEASFFSPEEIPNLQLVSSAKWLFDNHNLLES
ncbi:MAG: NUDIX hydrolase [bacterium]|nr:NUDIX hydrolase [bacterium]